MHSIFPSSEVTRKPVVKRPIRGPCLPRKAKCIQFSPRVKLLASRLLLIKTFQENYRNLLNM